MPLLAACRYQPNIPFLFAKAGGSEYTGIHHADTLQSNNRRQNLDFLGWNKNISHEFHDDNQVLFYKEFRTDSQGGYKNREY